MVTPRASEMLRISVWRADQPVLETGAQVGRRTGDADGRQMIDDAGGGDLAGVVPAHAVGNEPQAALRFDQVVVFIDLAHAALVAYAVAFERDGDIVHLPPSAVRAPLDGVLQGRELLCHKPMVWSTEIKRIVSQVLLCRPVKCLHLGIGIAQNVVGQVNPDKAGSENGLPGGFICSV